jgi:CheY-like chemotaxis protein
MGGSLLSGPQLTIGLFDDSEDGLVLMEDLLNATLRFLRIDGSDVNVLRVADHREAERIAATGDCHLVLTDLMWPVAGDREWPEGLNIAEVAKTANPRSVVVVITSKANQEGDFRDESRRREADLAFTWEEAFGSGKINNAKNLARRLEPSISSAVPKVERVARTTIGLVGLDTVAFSEEDDDIQLAVVKSFLSYMDEAWATVARPLVRPTFVFTGDGLFLGLAGDAGPRLALDVALIAWQRFTNLARYKTRLAVHSGPVNVATLSTGAEQLLGHSVNWLFRAVNAAPDDGLVVTDEYFATQLQGGRETPPGFSFTRRADVAKHDRPLVVHDVGHVR